MTPIWVYWYPHEDKRTAKKSRPASGMDFISTAPGRIVVRRPGSRAGRHARCRAQRHQKALPQDGAGDSQQDREAAGGDLAGAVRGVTLRLRSGTTLRLPSTSLRAGRSGTTLRVRSRAAARNGKRGTNERSDHQFTLDKQGSMRTLERPDRQTARHDVATPKASPL